MRFDTKRFIISLLIVFGIQYLAQIILAQFFSGIIFYLVYSIVIAFIFGFINYPPINRSYMFRDPYFYRYVCIMFIVIFLFNVIF